MWVMISSHERKKERERERERERENACTHHVRWIDMTHTDEIRTWNVDPLYPNPASPVQSCRKFSAVLGTTSPYKPIVIRPAGAPPISISIKTFFVTASGLCTAPAAAAMHLAPPLTSPTRRHGERATADVPRTLLRRDRIVIIRIAIALSLSLSLSLSILMRTFLYYLNSI